MGDFDDVTDARGKAILEIFSERQGADRAAAMADAEAQLPTSNKPGGGKVPQHFDVGNFGHEYAERLVPSLPKGLDKEVTVRLPDGGTKRLDRVDWKNGVIYEVKPDTKGSVAAGKNQVKLYIEYMNREHPLGGTRKWTGKVVTYDRKAVIRLLKNIGWIKTKPSQVKKVQKSSDASKKRARKVFAAGMALSLHAGTADNASAATASPRMTDQSAAVDRNVDTGRGADASQRMTNTPDKVPAVETRNQTQARISNTPDAPKILNQPGATSQTNVTPAKAAPKKGTFSLGRVSIDYDLTNPKSKDAFKLKTVDFGDFFKQNSKITSPPKSPFLKQLAGAGASSAAGLLSGWALDKIKAHFSGFIGEAYRTFEKMYLHPDILLDEAEIEEHEATFDAIMNEESGWWMKKPTKEMMEAIHGAFAYESAMIDLYERIHKQFLPDLPPIYQDVSQRSNVLFQIGDSVEGAFIKIHESGIGAVPMVYYQSFELWNVRTVFKDLSGEMGSLAGAISQRQYEYSKLVTQLDAKIVQASDQLEFWRSFYEKNKHLLN
jgi:hypothetical protein